MTDEEMKLVELTAEKAADAAVEKARNRWLEDINHHANKCQLNKYRGWKSFGLASIGGVIVAVINWFLRRL